MILLSHFFLSQHYKVVHVHISGELDILNHAIVFAKCGVYACSVRAIFAVRYMKCISVVYWCTIPVRFTMIPASTTNDEDADDDDDDNDDDENNRYSDSSW